MLEENKEKASEEEISNIEEAIKDLKKELESDNNTLESLKSVIEKLSEASQSLVTKIYEDTAKESDQHPDQDGEEDVVDGEVVEDE
jgi:chromosome segregation ATPase